MEMHQPPETKTGELDDKNRSKAALTLFQDHYAMQRSFLPCHRTVSHPVLCALLVCGLAGCGGNTVSPHAYKGSQYAATAQVRVFFQAEQVQPTCRVFAELFAFTPANVSARSIAAAITDEAKQRGAQAMLIGQSRVAKKDEGFRFLYIGPPREYAVERGWSNWSAGYNIWKDQGSWENLGLGEWGREDVLFPDPIAVQVAMLRCD